MSHVDITIDIASSDLCVTVCTPLVSTVLNDVIRPGLHRIDAGLDSSVGTHLAAAVQVAMAAPARGIAGVPIKKKSEATPCNDIQGVIIGPEDVLTGRLSHGPVSGQGPVCYPSQSRAWRSQFVRYASPTWHSMKARSAIRSSTLPNLSDIEVEPVLLPASAAPWFRGIGAESRGVRSL
jgi:hypothetical protein